jgi:hypothetical protein
MRIMKRQFMLIAVLLIAAATSSAQTITVEKICKCTFDGDITSVHHNSSKIIMEGKYQTDVKITNTGTCTWEVKDVELRLKIVRCPSGSACQRDEFFPKKWDMNEKHVLPGYSEYFVFDWEAPQYNGKFVLSYQLYYDGKPFGDAITSTIEILPKPSR